MELWVHVSRLPVLHLDSDQWKHFILNILLLVGGDATHSFTSILLLHALHTLDHNCTCQNNPSLGFFFWHVQYLHVFSSISAHMVVWEAFLFLLTHHHLCTCALISSTISLIIIHHNFFHHVGGGVGNSSSSSSHHHLHVSSHITHHHSSQLSSHCQVFFMHTKLSVPICKGVRFTEHQLSPVLSRK